MSSPVNIAMPRIDPASITAYIDMVSKLEQFFSEEYAPFINGQVSDALGESGHRHLRIYDGCYFTGLDHSTVDFKGEEEVHRGEWENRWYQLPTRWFQESVDWRAEVLKDLEPKIRNVKTAGMDAKARKEFEERQLLKTLKEKYPNG